MEGHLHATAHPCVCVCVVHACVHVWCVCVDATDASSWKLLNYILRPEKKVLHGLSP